MPDQATSRMWILDAHHSADYLNELVIDEIRNNASAIFRLQICGYDTTLECSRVERDRVPLGVPCEYTVGYDVIDKVHTGYRVSTVIQLTYIRGFIDTSECNRVPLWCPLCIPSGTVH
jgi:hypothetical protein